MEIAINIFVFIHLLGMAALVGGSLAQVRDGEKHVSALMRDGAGTQLVTGLVLVGLLHANGEAVNDAVAGIKLAFVVVILALIILGRKQLSHNAYYAIVGLSIADVALALFVTSATQS